MLVLVLQPRSRMGGRALFGRVVALALVLILLGACAREPQSTTAPEALPGASSESEISALTEIVLAIPRDADEILAGTARHFADLLHIRTNGEMAVIIVATTSPDDVLLAGTAQIALLNTRGMMEFCEILSATATSFIYNGYTNFLMRANAERTMIPLEFSLRENHGLVPLGAFYQGAMHLLINFSPGGYQHFEGRLIIIEGDENTATAFQRLTDTSGGTIAYSDGNTRFEMFLQGYGDAVEIHPSDLAGSPELLPYTAHLIASYHNLVPIWMLASADFMDNLTPQARGHLLEAQAYMSNRVSEAYRQAELEVMRVLRQEYGVAVVAEFSNVRNRIFNTLGVLDEDASPAQRLARDLIWIMRSTA